MLGFIIRLIINAIAIVAIAQYVPGFEVNSYVAAGLFAIVLGLINAVIRPVIMLFTLPITLLTVGLFTFVINAVLFWLASLFVEGVAVDTVLAAILGSLILSVVSWILSLVLK